MNTRFAALCAFGAAALLSSSPALAALPAFAAPTTSQMRVHYIDVGQGSSVLLEFACGTVLIDTGSEKNEHFDGNARLKKYLDAYFARRTDRARTIDLLLLTHAHIDHARGIATVLKNYKVRNLVDNGLEWGSGGLQQKAAHRAVQESGGAIKYQAVSETDLSGPTGITSDVIDPIGKCGSGTDPKFLALWGALDTSAGWDEDTLTNGNNSSVVVRLEFGKATFLFPGDLEDAVQDELVDIYTESCTSNCLLDVDVYQVSHHGSLNGTSPALIDAMKKPLIAAIAMGPNTRSDQWSARAHGHPRKTIVEALMNPVDGVVNDRATPKSVMVALRGLPKRKRPPNTPPPKTFVTMQVSKAVYGTGWDGTVVITAQADGSLHVDTEK